METDPKSCHASRELYNHNVDPEENYNLAARPLPAVVGVLATLSAKLQAGPEHALVDNSGHR